MECVFFYESKCFSSGVAVALLSYSLENLWEPMYQSYLWKEGFQDEPLASTKANFNV